MFNLELFAIGFISGLVGSIFGIGGGIIIVTCLVNLYSIDPRFAVGTSIFSIVLSSTTAVIYNSFKKRIEFKTALKILISTIPGSIFGSFIVNELSKKTFNIIFSLILFSLSIIVFMKNRNSKGIFNFDKRILFLFLFVVGILSSTTGIGGGLVYTPLLNYFFGFSVLNSVSTSQFVLSVTTFFALLSHLFNGNVQLQLSIPIAISAITGSFLGVKLNHLIPEKFVQWGLFFILITFALYLQLKSI